MSKNTYQAVTSDTPIELLRSDFMHRQAVCIALADRYAGLAAVATQSGEVVADIDSHREGLRSAEDDVVRARALEDARRIEVIDVYAGLRGNLGLQQKDNLFAFLPDPPSALGRLGTKKFAERLGMAITNLERLPETDRVRVDFLPKLQAELAEFQSADQAEDATRARLRSARLGMLVYKSELARVRDAQLGTIQTATRDRAKTALFTIRFRKSAANDDEPETTSPPPAAATTPPATP